MGATRVSGCDILEYQKIAHSLTGPKLEARTSQRTVKASSSHSRSATPFLNLLERSPRGFSKAERYAMRCSEFLSDLKEATAEL